MGATNDRVLVSPSTGRGTSSRDVPPPATLVGMDTRQYTPAERAALRDPGSDDDWGPPMEAGGGGRRTRRPRRRRAWRVLLLVLLVPLVAVAAYGGALTWHLMDSIERIDVPGRSARTGSRVNVLVIGSDSRENLSDDQRRELTTGDAVGERTDSIMVLSVAGRDASLTSFPRDLWVTRCDGSQGRINAALGLDGPGCLVDTVESLGDFPIHHYVDVDFGGFQGLVDAVDGVEICVDKALDDPLAGIDLEPGCQVMDGTTALGYVRTRKLDNDLERIRRQQQFVAALAGAVASPDTLRSPVRAWRTTGAVGEAIRADRDLGLVALARLGLGARAMAAGDLETATVPGTAARINGAAVLEPDLSAAQELFDRLRSDAVPGVEADQDAAPVDLPGRDEVGVTVLNGGTVSGGARATADALAGLGYAITDVGNAEPTETTTIVVGPGGELAAERLSSDLPLSAVVDDDGEIGDRTVVGTEVVLVLGSDLDPTQLDDDGAG